MSTSTSYLQTLSPAEASAFATSLQQVQAHLQQELAWMNQQVQQKRMQLQGVETLLTDASTLGLLKSDAVLTSDPVSSAAQATRELASEPEATEAAAPTAVPPSVADDVEANADASEDVPIQSSVSPPDQVATLPAPVQSKQTASKPSAKAKPRQSSSPKATTKKQPITKSQSRSKGGKAQVQPKSRALLRPEFADTSLTDAVTQVLTQAAAPLHLDQIVSELYENVSGEDLKRVKGALANVLSKGKKSGKWRNVGNGIYQIEA